MSTTNNADSKPASNWRRILLTILGTLALGILGSGLWETVVGPCLNWLGNLTLSIISFGSDSLRDKAYCDAALDPTAIPSLSIQIMLLSGMLGCFVSILLLTTFPSFLMMSRKQPDSSSKEELKTLLNKLRRTAQILGVYIVFLIGLMCGASLILNQSVLIWRSFHADMRICAAGLKLDEEKDLYSRFASMKSKQDYAVILDRLRATKPDGVELHSERLW